MDMNEASSNKPTCTWEYVVNVSPLLGGYRSLDEGFEHFKFMGNYKLTAKDDKVILMDELNSQTIQFEQAIIFFQEKMEPIARKTVCHQHTIFKEKSYYIQVNPFENQLLEASTVIFAHNNKLSFKSVPMKNYSDPDEAKQILRNIIMQLSMTLSDGPPKMKEIIIKQKGNLKVHFDVPSDTQLSYNFQFGSHVTNNKQNLTNEIKYNVEKTYNTHSKNLSISISKITSNGIPITDGTFDVYVYSFTESANLSSKITLNLTSENPEELDTFTVCLNYKDKVYSRTFPIIGNENNTISLTKIDNN
jgi:hypothetical protein